jgi:hypothetical protein
MGLSGPSFPPRKMVVNLRTVICDAFGPSCYNHHILLNDDNNSCGPVKFPFCCCAACGALSRPPRERSYDADLP